MGGTRDKRRTKWRKRSNINSLQIDFLSRFCPARGTSGTESGDAKIAQTVEHAVFSSHDTGRTGGLQPNTARSGTMKFSHTKIAQTVEHAGIGVEQSSTRAGFLLGAHHKDRSR